MISTCDLDGVNDAFEAMQARRDCAVVIVYPETG